MTPVGPTREGLSALLTKLRSGPAGPETDAAVAKVKAQLAELEGTPVDETSPGALTGAAKQIYDKLITKGLKPAVARAFAIRAAARAKAADQSPATAGAQNNANNGYSVNLSGYEPEPYSAEDDETVQCPVCGKMNDDDARFCDQCGVKLVGRDDVTTGGDGSGGTSTDDTESAEGTKMSSTRPALTLAISQDERAAAAKSGQALPDGSFPMRNRVDLANAISSWGRAVEAGKATVVKSLMLKRAKALGVGPGVVQKIQALSTGGSS